MIHWLTQSHDVVPHTAVNGQPTLFLSDSEAARLASLPTKKKQQDWLLDHWTAKRLLQTVIWETKGTTVPLDLITVHRSPNGIPTIESQLPLVNGQFTLAMSQTQGRALVTAVAKPDWPIGANIKQIQPQKTCFFTAAETARLENIDDNLRDMFVTAVCSAKEAVQQALHLYDVADTHSISCLIDPEKRPSDTWVPLKIRYRPTPLAQTLPHLSGWWRVMDQFVLSVVVQQ